MSYKFDTAFTFIRQAEGGYGFDPADAGGETFIGISRAAHPDWPGWPVVDEAQKAGGPFAKRLAADPDMTALAANLYRREYWERLGLEAFPERAATTLLDTFVQHGCAARLVQQALNRGYAGPALAEDNRFGPATRGRLLAVADSGLVAQAGLIEAILVRREDYYRSLAAKPGQSRFLNGWLNRLERLRAYLARIGDQPDDQPGPASPADARPRKNLPASSTPPPTLAAKTDAATKADATATTGATARQSTSNFPVIRDKEA